MGFAIPSAIVSFAYPQLRQYGHLHRGVIGIHVQSISPGMAAGLGLSRDWGVIIADVSPGSPADKAGLKVQDIIHALNRGATNNLEPLYSALHHLKPGSYVVLQVERAAGLYYVTFQLD